MRPVRVLVVAVLALGGLAAVPAGAAQGLPALTSGTVVTAASSGFVDVELTRDARLSPRSTGNPDVALSGTGRLVGLWLEPLDTDASPGDTLEALRLPGFLGAVTRTTGTTEPAPVCKDDLTGGQSCTTPTPTAILLHAGRYRLTVLTDGHPVSVALRLHGLPARTTSLRPAHSLVSAELPLPARETVGDRHVTYGGQGPLAGSLRTFVVASAKPGGSARAGWSVCDRRDPATAAPFAYSTACPGSTSGGYALSVHQGSYGVFGAWVGGGVDDATPVSLGGSFTNDGGVVLGQALGVWLRMA
jgi:hypothetical protein